MNDRTDHVPAADLRPDNLFRHIWLIDCQPIPVFPLIYEENPPRFV